MNANRSVTRRWFATGWVGLLLAGWLALGTVWAEPVVHYLTVDGAGNEDGSSWANASSNIQAALELTDIDEIRMAGGIHDLTLALEWTAGSNVTVRGGYDAATGDHDPANQVTILRQTASGQRVLLVEGLDDCRIEHVTVTGGYLNDRGAGVRVNDSDVVFADCVISNNVVASPDHSAVSIEGGGIYVNGGAVTVLNSRIAYNRVDNISGNGRPTRGGGLYLANGSVLLENTHIVGNVTFSRGSVSLNSFSAGVEHVAGKPLTIRNSLIAYNENQHETLAFSRYGAGVILRSGGLIENSTIVANRMYNEAHRGAGLWMYGGTVTNTIVWGNRREEWQNDIGFGSGVSEAGNVFYSCASELTDGVNNNLGADPLFIDAADGNFRLDRGSPCVDTGYEAAWMAAAVDLDGNPRIQDGRPDRPAAPDRGAFERAPLDTVGDLTCDFVADVYIGVDALDVVFTAFVGGSETNGLVYRWDFNNNGTFDAEGADKRVVTNQSYSPGVYTVRLVVENDQSATATLTKTGYIQVASSILYVSLQGNGTTGWNWTDAYTNLQSAINQPGVSEIRVAGGVYGLTNQIELNTRSGITVRGGYDVAADTHDPDNQSTILNQTMTEQRVIRMIDLADCRLEHVTITGGYTSDYGAGICSRNSDVTLVSCVISNNVLANSGHSNTPMDGGGLYINGGAVVMLTNRVENNWAWIFDDNGRTSRGGGIYLANGSLWIEHSSIVSNISHARGDSRFYAYSAGIEHEAGRPLTIRNCLIAFNENRHDHAGERTMYGAGVVLRNGGLIESSTIAGNLTHSETHQGAGLRVYGGTVTNTIIAGNLRDGLPNDIGFGGAAGEAGSVLYSCAPELTLTEAPNHNLPDNPLFLDAAGGNFHLDRGSPCVDTGYEAAWMAAAVDLDGNPRIQDGRPDRPLAPDRGAYELAPLSDEGDLTCDFGADVYTGIDTLEVEFTAFVGGAETNGLVYRWDFTDDGTFNENGGDKRVVTNVYGPGVHSVRLEVQNDPSDVATMTKTGYIQVASSILYVSLQGNGTTGGNWIDAYTNLQTAIDQSGISQIRVAGGEYSLTNQIDWIGHSGVTIRGGYDAAGDVHDPENQITILRQTASHQRVMRLIDLEACRLEYVTVTGGNTIHEGAGLHVINSGIEIVQCVVTNNILANSTHTAAAISGGGMFINGGTVAIVTSRIENNGVILTGGNGRPVRGGGIYLAEGSLLLEHSTVSGNITRGNGSWGAGTSQSAGIGHESGRSLTIRNCLIAFNENQHNHSGELTTYGAGVVLRNGGLIESSTIAGNITHSETYQGAGLRVDGGMVTNTIISGNVRDGLANDIGFGGSANEAGNVFYSGASELTDGVNHNLNADPLFLDADAGNFRLDLGSPCVDTGYEADWMATASDLDGNPRIQDGRPDRPLAPDRGAYELAPLSEEGDLICDFVADGYTGIDTLEVEFTAFVGGSETNITAYRWDFNNNGTFDLEGADKRVVTSTYGPGVHSVRLEVQNDPSDVATMTKIDYIQVASSILYVSLQGNGTTGWNWTDAYTNLQAAIDQSGVSEIRVAGGEYSLTNQIDWIGHSGVTIRGGYDAAGDVHDPENQITILRQTASDQRVMRLIDLEACRLEYVTVTGGYTIHEGAGLRVINSGIEIVQCVVTNNILANPTHIGVAIRGGGMFINGGTVAIVTSRIENNGVILTGGNGRPVRGGGIYLAEGSLLLEHSTVSGNITRGRGSWGAGTSQSAGIGHESGRSLTIRNCLIAFNENQHNYSGELTTYGAGVVLRNGGLIESSTIAGNITHSETYQGAGLRVYGGTVTNTIIAANVRDGLSNDIGFGAATEADNVFYSCASELTLTDAPNHNLPDDPLFLDSAGGDFRLQQGSPAIDAGINQPWMFVATDLNGLTRILMGTVDMGCYETPPPRGSLFMFR